MKIFLKFLIFLVNLKQQANGSSCVLQCQGQKPENRVRENALFLLGRNSQESFFQNSLQKACLPAHMSRDAGTCQRMRCCHDQGIFSKS